MFCCSNDAGLYFDGTDFILISDGAGAGGIKLDSEDDTLEFLGSGAVQLTLDMDGIDLITGNDYQINNTSVLTNNTLGSGVTASSLTSVGTIATGVWNGTDIAVADGGTGASSVSAAASNLGLGVEDSPTFTALTATTTLTINNTSGGDPILQLQDNSTNTWFLGFDNSDANKFRITP